MSTERRASVIQSASAQDWGLLEYEAPSFTWIRPKACRVEVEAPLQATELLAAAIRAALPQPLADQALGWILQEQHAVVICAGEEEQYEPLTEAPHAYLSFASLARMPSQPGELEKNAVRFVMQYGLPRDSAPFVAAGGHGFPLEVLLSEASLMNTSVKLLDATRKAERDGDYRTLRELYRRNEKVAKVRKENLLVGSKQYLVSQLNENLRGVDLAPSLDVDERRFATSPRPVRRTSRTT